MNRTVPTPGIELLYQFPIIAESDYRRNGTGHDRPVVNCVHVQRRVAQFRPE